MATKLKILIAEPDHYSPVAIKEYKKIGSVKTVDYRARNFTKELIQANVLILRLGFKVDGKILNQAKHLQVIAVNTTGLNHINLMECQKRGIKVISLRGHTDFLDKIHATPELTWGLLLSLVRKIPWAFLAVKQGKWNRYKFAGRELNGKILGILGLGRVGRIVARYGQVFGMTVMACDPEVSLAAMKKLGVKKVSLGQLFQLADVVTIHVLYEDKLENLITERELKKMKPTAYLINTARGELIDEKALGLALKNGWLAGVALDVLANETSDGSHLNHNQLHQYAKTHDNLLLVPHIGGAAIEAWQATEEYLAGLVADFYQSKKR